MSEELKVKIPDGYRWVEAGEDRNGRIWKTQQGGYWCNTIMPICCSNYHIITPIEPQKPEAVDVEVIKTDSALGVKNPNDGCLYLLHNFPSIVGPDWAFAGFVWDGPPNDQAQRHYYKIKATGVVYAKAVRFRRVQRGAK